MIRWSYVLPRSLVLLVLLSSAHYGIPIVLRWGMVQVISRLTGTQAEVRSVWASPARGQVRIRGFSIARDSESEKNLVQCESASFGLNWKALADRRFVIDDAQIHGIRFDAPRTLHATGSSSSAFPTLDMNQAARQGEALSRVWLEHTTKLLQRRVEDEFQSLQIARQLSERWPADYRDLQRQISRCHQSALQLYQALTAIPSAGRLNDNLSLLQQRSQDVLQLGREISQLQTRLSQVASQIEQDRTAITTALEFDRDKLRRNMALVKLDDQTLNHYLLDSEVCLWWEQFRPWLDFARWLGESPDMNQLGQRGQVVQFGSDEPLPRVFLRSAVLDGQLRLAGQQVAFRGRANNWTLLTDPQSRSLSDPARLHLVTEGPFRARVRAQLDCVDGAARRQIIVDCDSMPLETRRWGHEGKWRVTVAPGAARIRARLIVTGDQLDGRIQLFQNDIQLSITPGTGSAWNALSEPLVQAASTIDHFELTADLTGSVDAPQWKIRSDVGPQLQQRFQIAVEQLVRAHAEHLVGEAESRIHTQLEQWRRDLPVAPDELEQQLAATRQLLSSLAQPATARMRPWAQLLR